MIIFEVLLELIKIPFFPWGIIILIYIHGSIRREEERQKAQARRKRQREMLNKRARGVK